MSDEVRLCGFHGGYGLYSDGRIVHESAEMVPKWNHEKGANISLKPFLKYRTTGANKLYVSDL